MQNVVRHPAGTIFSSPKLLKFEKQKFYVMDRRVINIDPEILGGTPVFFGTRVPIKNLFDYLETGDSIEVFLEDFDGVSKDQVIKVLEMSQKLIESSTNILNENFA
ncbi:MAG: DUF433 domain-containing protein [Ferruginibacter sp.]